MKINRFYDGDSGFDLVYEGYIKSLVIRNIDAYDSIEEVSEKRTEKEEAIK